MAGASRAMAQYLASERNTRLIERVDYLDLIGDAESEAYRVEWIARWILREFDAYYCESRRIPDLAKKAFEGLDPGRSLALSKRRLSIYSESIHALGPRVADGFPALAESEQL